MLDQGTIQEFYAATDKRREERRKFLKVAGGAAAAVGGASLLAACNHSDEFSGPGVSTATPTPTPTSTIAASDVDVLNFALNLEYLEANFYSYAAFGAPLNSTSMTGTGTQGTITGGKAVTFTDPVVQQYAREIAADENQHVLFLRKTLGSAAVAMPAINIDGGATGAFTAAARAAGVVPANGVFDPYASDENFLLGAFIFEDVGVTAYKGASILLSKTYIEAAAGILAVEAYHAGLVRTVLYSKGIATPSNNLITNAGKISDARDSLDGASDDDQGIITGTDTTAANIVPADLNTSIAFSRTAANVLNVVYLNSKAVVGGGFFPSGVNGNIKTSNAN